MVRQSNYDGILKKKEKRKREEKVDSYALSLIEIIEVNLETG